MSDGVLIIDSDVTSSGRISEVLTAVGYDVTLAQDGHEALQLLNPELHRVIFVAEYLRDLGGLELILDIRLISSASEFILVTGSHDPLLEQEATAAGVSEWLFIPASPVEILQTTSRAAAAADARSENGSNRPLKRRAPFQISG